MNLLGSNDHGNKQHPWERSLITAIAPVLSVSPEFGLMLAPQFTGLTNLLDEVKCHVRRREDNSSSGDEPAESRKHDMPISFGLGIMQPSFCWNSGKSKVRFMVESI
jgi:hypothetical protein